MIRRPAALISGLTLAAALAVPVLAQSPVLVTVTGAIENANREAMDPDWDKLFFFNNAEFELAHELTFEDLRSLPQTTVRADFPKGGEEMTFTGPSFEALFEEVGAAGDIAIITAIDGYAVEVPRQELVEKGAVLAIARDGEPLALGGVGPAMVAYPRAERAELAEMTDDGWIWQIYHIRLE